MHQLFFCLWWRQIGFQHRTPIEFGFFLLHAGIDREGYGTPLSGQLDPISDTELCGTGHELLHRTLGLGARMVGEGVMLLGDLCLERRQFRVPGVPDFLGTYRIPPQHVAYTFIREHLGQFLIEEVHLKGPLAQQFFNLGFRNGSNVMAPLLSEVCDLLAFNHATVANEGNGLDAKPCLDLVELRSKGVRTLGITRKPFDRDGMAVLVAE